MLYKRVVGVITVKQGWAVQSFGYGRYLPLGRPEIIAKNLDRWGADEIMLLSIDSTREGLGPDLALLERVAKKGLSTPLIYAGGIATAQDGVDAVHAGADRVAIDALLWDRPDAAGELETRLGAQAVIAALPLSVEPAGLMRRDYRTGELAPMGEPLLSIMRERTVSEVLAIDWRHEGGHGYDFRIVEQFPVADMPIIAFGGLADADQIRDALRRPTVVAAAVGNSLNYREHAVRLHKQALGDMPIRAPSHQRWNDH